MWPISVAQPDGSQREYSRQQRIDEVAAIKHDYAARLHQQRVGGWLLRPAARSLHRAVVTVPGASAQAGSLPRTAYRLVYGLAALVVYPLAALVGTAVSHHAPASAAYFLMALWQRLPSVVRAASVALLNARALLSQNAIIFAAAPAACFLCLVCFLYPGALRRRYDTCAELLSGKTHASRCALARLTQRQVERRTPEDGDTCPVCIEVLNQGDLVYCKWGCGRAVHAVCLQSWRSHRNEHGMTECLFCKAWM